MLQFLKSLFIRSLRIWEALRPNKCCIKTAGDKFVTKRNLGSTAGRIWESMCFLIVTFIVASASPEIEQIIAPTTESHAYV